MCRWRDVIAGSSTPIPPIRNLFSQNQLEIASTGKQIVIAERREMLSQSLPMFQVQTLCCLTEVSKYIGAELQCLLVKGLNSTDSKTHVRYS